MAGTKLFARRNEGQWTDVGSGNRRRVLLHTDELMMVEFAFEKGARGLLHSHPHVQASYIARGSFEVTVDGRSAVLFAGQSFVVPSGAEHGVLALEDGLLVDCFTPARADFLR